ncbi:MAG: serine hydrolase domain-containing protein [Pseudomonadota bacterium]
MKHGITLFFMFLALMTSTVAATSEELARRTDTIQLASGIEMPASELDALIETAMVATKTPGVSIALINNGTLVYENAFGVAHIATQQPLTTRSVFEAASLSKPLFGFFAMTFVEEGLLDLDKPLHDYLPNPDFPDDARYRRITARHVLSHQTGLPNWRDDNPELGLTLKFTPGEGFFYSGEGYEYLAEVLAHLAGTDDNGLEALFQERIAKPLGMTRTTFIATRDQLCARATPHRDGSVIRLKAQDPTFGAAYSIHTDAGDYIRFGLGVMQGKILQAATYEQFLSAQGSPIPANDPGRAFGLSDWALGFSIYDLPFGRFYAHGGNNPGYSSMFFVSPDREWGAVIFTNADQANDFLMAVSARLGGLDGYQPSQ